MKRVKIMLLSLAFFAVLGADLAFKARFGQLYCTAPTLSDGACPVYCPNSVLSFIVVGGEIPFVCTTTPTTYLEGPIVRSTCFINNDKQLTLICAETPRQLMNDL